MPLWDDPRLVTLAGGHLDLVIQSASPSQEQISRERTRWHLRAAWSRQMRLLRSETASLARVATEDGPQNVHGTTESVFAQEDRGIASERSKARTAEEDGADAACVGTSPTWSMSVGQWATVRTQMWAAA